MDYFEVVKARHSIRAFRAQPVEEEKIHRIIESVNLAPSAGDLQAYQIVVVKDSRRKAELAKAAWGQSFVAEAPVCFVFLAYPELSSRKYGQRGSELYCLQDATIAASYAELAATALGLASTWVGAFNDEAVAKTVEAPRDRRPIAVLPVGYPAETPDITPRRPIDEFVHRETVGTPYSFSSTNQSFQRPTWKPRP
ncbi:nitroreductase family protein [[Eubacterium] cellulosolvens]